MEDTITNDIDFKRLCFGMINRREIISTEEMSAFIENEIGNWDLNIIETSFVILKNSTCELLCAGNIIFYENKYEKAIEFYKIVIDKYGNDITNCIATNNIAVCKLKLQQYDESIEMFRTCVKKYSCIYSLFNLSIVHYITGDFDKFVKYMTILNKKGYTESSSMLLKYFNNVFLDNVDIDALI